MKKSYTLIFLLLLTQAFSLFSQTNNKNPNFWFRADSTALGNSFWRDVSGTGHHAYSLSSAPFTEYSSMNFNKSFPVISGESYVVPSWLADHNEATVIIVYESSDSIAEQGLWSLSVWDGARIGLTSQRILNTGSNFIYQDSNSRFRVINSLLQGWNRKEGSPLPDTCFRFCIADSLHYRGNISELLFFDHKLTDNVLTEYISYLAIKYGVTLYQTDYRNRRGDVFWNYSDYPIYSASIGGLGRDTVLGLHQRQSFLTGERMIVGLDSYREWNEEHARVIPEGNYLVWGFDSALLDVATEGYWEDGSRYVSYGNGLLQSTGSFLSRTKSFVRVNGSDWEGDLSSYFLLLDRSGEGNFSGATTEGYPADSIDSEGWIYYSNIYWDPDGSGTDRFCFARFEGDSLPGIPPRSLAISGNGEENNGKDSRDASLSNREPIYRLYPNPASGEFSIEAEYPKSQEVTVTIYNPEGKQVERYYGAGSAFYRFSGNLKVKGQYLVEVASAIERKTLKLIIQ